MCCKWPSGNGDSRCSGNGECKKAYAVIRENREPLYPEAAPGQQDEVECRQAQHLTLCIV